MSLVDKIDEIIGLNNRRLIELRNVPLEDTRRIGRYDYALDLEESLYCKLKEQEKINKKYNMKISELYEQINKNLNDDKKLFNPFIKKGERK